MGKKYTKAEANALALSGADAPALPRGEPRTWRAGPCLSLWERCHRKVTERARTLTKSREGGGRAANRLALSVSHTLASSPKGGAKA